MGSRINIALVLLVASLLPACDERIEPKVPIDADNTIDAGVCMATGTLAPLDLCTADLDCTSCVCKLFGHEKKCSKTCSVPSDCPAPFTGCTNNFCAP
ncbi:MAG: hypothetical protein NT062_18550 [Proteobacteria bacterium]|nr:hypothetical protein [Pseudomonadota bacterium]